MKASRKHMETFYQKLGYLFYSIAAADKHIVKEEADMLHRMVMEDWLNLESTTDEFGTDAAFQIEVVFDYAMDQMMNSEKAFHAFEVYYKENLSLFSDDVIHRIFHTADRVASAFHSRNKAELTSLTRLHFLLGRERHVL